MKNRSSNSSLKKMTGNKREMAVFCFLIFTFFSLSIAQDPHDEYLVPHNKAREEVGVPPLTWNETLEAFAQKYAEERISDCKFEHSNGPYGENIAYGSYEEFTAAEAVKLWVDEKSLYNYDTNACEGGECLHYTQIVWRDTLHVGCARVKWSNGYWFVVCEYDPWGNIVGEKPY